MRILCLTLITLLAPMSALAQDHRPVDPSEAARRAAEGKQRLAAAGKAGEIVLRGIERHGGLEAWFAGKALRFDYRFDPVGDAPPIETTQVVDLLASRVYHDIKTPGAGRFAFNGERAWVKLDDEAFQMPPRFWALTPYYFVAMPFVLGDPGVKLEVIGDDPAAVGLPAADVIKVTYESGTGDAPDDYYIAYFARDDGRLLAVRYIVTYKPLVSKSGGQPGPEKMLVYGDFQKVGPLTLARSHGFFTVVDGKRGDKSIDAGPSAIEHGVAFDEAKLVMPEGARVSEL